MLKEKIYDMHKKSVCIISLNVNLSSNFCGDQVLEDTPLALAPDNLLPAHGKKRAMPYPYTCQGKVPKHPKHLRYHYLQGTLYKLCRTYKNNNIYGPRGLPIKVIWLIDWLNSYMSLSSSGMIMMVKKPPREYAKRAGERVKA